MSDSDFIVIYIHSCTFFLGFLDLENGVKGDEDGQPEIVSSAFNILTVFIEICFGI